MIYKESINLQDSKISLGKVTESMIDISIPTKISSHVPYNKNSTIYKQWKINKFLWVSFRCIQ